VLGSRHTLENAQEATENYSGVAPFNVVTMGGFRGNPQLCAQIKGKLLLRYNREANVT